VSVKRSFVYWAVAAILSSSASAAWSQVRGTIRGPGARAYPIALSPLKNLGGGVGSSIGTEFVDILARDLELTGLFRMVPRDTFIEEPQTSGITVEEVNFESWSVIGALALVKGGYTIEGEKVTLEARLFDVYQRRQMAGRRYHGTAQDVRRMANKFADEIMREFTGERGPFDSRIAFVSNRGGRFKDVYVMSPDGGDILQVTRSQSISLAPAWSPDVHQLVYTSYKRGNPDFYLLDFISGRETKITAGRELHVGARFSPDGRTLAAAIEQQGNVDIYLLDLGGKILRRLTSDPGIDVSPTWSPDGRQIAFTSGRTGQPQIHVMGADGSGQRRITYEGRYNTSPAWSPKGDSIAYTSRADGGFNIFTIHPDGTEVHQVTSSTGNNEDPNWSPDGRYLVFASTRRGVAGLYVSDATGASQVALTDRPGGDTSPAWSNWLE
jgi:TolB protein